MVDLAIAPTGWAEVATTTVAEFGLDTVIAETATGGTLASFEIGGAEIAGMAATGIAEYAGIESVAALGGPVGMAVAGVGIGGYMLWNLISDAIKKD